MTAATPTKPRILLADDHRILLDSLVASLTPHYQIVAQVEALASLREAIERTAPDVVLLDLLFGGESALPLLRDLLADPTIRARFVVLSGAENPTLVGSTATSGIMAFVPKEVGVEELRRAIDAALVGERYARDVGEGRDAAEPIEGAVWVGGVKLRRRQVEVIWLLLAGLERGGIAARLSLTKDAVDYHLKNVRKRLGFHSSRQVLSWAAEHLEEFRSAGHSGHSPAARMPPPPSIA